MEAIFFSLATLSFLVGRLEGQLWIKMKIIKNLRESYECKCRKTTLLLEEGMEEPSSSSNLAIHQKEKDWASNKEIVSIEQEGV